MKKTFRIAVSALLALTIVFAFTGCVSGDYNKARKLMDKGDYDAARTLLTPITDYKDAVNLLYTCNYRLLERDIAANGSTLDGVKCINTFFPVAGEDGEYTLYAEADANGLHLVCRQKELVGIIAVSFRLDLPISANVVPFRCVFEAAGNVLATRAGTVDITTATADTVLTYADDANANTDVISGTIASLTGSVIESAVQDCFRHIVTGGDELLQQSGTGVTLASLGFYAAAAAEPATA